MEFDEDGFFYSTKIVTTQLAIDFQVNNFKKPVRYSRPDRLSCEVIFLNIYIAFFG